MPASESGSQGLGDQNFDNGRLDTCAEIRQTFWLLQNARVVSNEIADGSLQAAEAKIVAWLVQHRSRKAERRRVAALRQPVQGRPPRIGQAEQPGHFIEALTGRVIHG